MSAAEEITDDEFQFYKQELQKNVKEYLQLGDELDALKKAAKERAATKKEVTEKIIDLMKKIDITHLNIKEGRLGTKTCLLYTSPSPRDGLLSRMPSSA